MTKKILLWVLVLLVIAGGLVFWGKMNQKSALSQKSNRELALTCAPGGMAENFHIHPQLHILINGVEQPLPHSIGVTASCMNPIHTHDDVPNIHIEAPEKRDFTIGDFFAVWNQPFNKDEILTFKADRTHTITMTVNGIAVDSFENTVLKDKDQLVISYQSI